jgi:hypothetical protein
MREMRLSGSMSGNRNQSHAKPDCGAVCESRLYEGHRETTATAPVLDSTQISGPPPNCKRFEVGRSSVRVNVFGFLWRIILRARDHDPHVCGPSKWLGQLGTHLSAQVYRHAVGLWFRSFSPQQTFGTPKSHRWGRGKVEKRSMLSKRSVLHGLKPAPMMGSHQKGLRGASMRDASTGAFLP